MADVNRIYIIKFVDFRPFSGGGDSYSILPIEIFFFYVIFLVVVAISQGSLLLVLKMFCDNLTIFDRSFKNTHAYPKLCMPV